MDKALIVKLNPAYHFADVSKMVPMPKCAGKTTGEGRWKTVGHKIVKVRL